jgi:hypothetical protein
MSISSTSELSKSAGAPPLPKDQQPFLAAKLGEKIKKTCTVARQILFFVIAMTPGVSILVFLPKSAYHSIRALTSHDKKIKQTNQNKAQFGLIVSIPIYGNYFAFKRMLMYYRD